MAILYKGLEHPGILVSEGVLEPTPYRYPKATTFLKIYRMSTVPLSMSPALSTLPGTQFVIHKYFLQFIET